jgi:DNA mismatch repair protein MutS2
LSSTVNFLLNYFKKFDDYYPQIPEPLKWSSQRNYHSVDAIVDKCGEIKDNASPELLNIRRDINSIRGKVNQGFGVALTQYNSLGYLDDIKESFFKTAGFGRFSDVPS